MEDSVFPSLLDSNKTMGDTNRRRRNGREKARKTERLKKSGTIFAVNL